MSKDIIEKLCNIEEWLVNYIDREFGSQQCFEKSGELAVSGELIDMIKDIAEAKEKCVKAKYYETVTKAMEEYDEEEPEERQGYNNRRYANGRYAPTGRGEVRGYPMMPHPTPLPVMGYPNTPGGGSNNGNMSSSNNMTGTPSGRSGYDPGMIYEFPPQSERGQHYDNWREAKRYYTETRSEEHKKRMREHANDYVNNTVAALLEIWNSADPDQKQYIKNNMTPLISGMNS